MTNEDAIGTAHKIIRNGIETLHNMGDEPISKIEGFAQETLTAIRKIDLTPIRKEVEELQNEREDWIRSTVR